MAEGNPYPAQYAESLMSEFHKMKWGFGILLSLLWLLQGCEKKEKEIPRAVAVSLDGSMEVGLMTFNLRYENENEDGKRAWRNRVVGIVGMLQRENIEILGVQEALHGQVADLWASMPNFSFEGVGRKDGKKRGEYTGIFYRNDRFQSDPKNRGTIWLSDTPYKAGSKTWGNTYPRVATWIRLLDRSSGQALWVVNIHLDHINQPSREKGVQLMAHKLAEMNRNSEPVVWMGDFNGGEWNPAVRYLADGLPANGLSKAFPGLKETYYQLHPRDKARGTLHFWMSDPNRQWKVDHIFVSKQAKVLEAKIVKSGEPYLSDHFPVKARVKFLKSE
jgi:endonuclease/exonuclease/phosphatase family metal-dependent hydrolase